MADPTVVAIVKARLLTLSGITFLETLNARPNLPTSIDRKFITIEADYADVDRITLGQPAMYREIGGLYVVCQTASGKGLTVANALAEMARGLFFDYAVGYFRVTAAKAAVSFENDDGNWFTLKVPVQYVFDFFKP